MQKEILEFLNTQRVGVIAVTMPDGSPHGATIHFAFDKTTSTFIFLTSPKSIKGKALNQREFTATFVIGTTEELMKTLQMDGIGKSIDTPELREIYFAKFTEKLNKKPEDVIFTFTPIWWRFTDFKAPSGKLILTSE